MRLTRFALVCAIAVAAALPIGFSAAARRPAVPLRSATKRNVPPAAKKTVVAANPATAAAPLTAPVRAAGAKAARVAKLEPRPVEVVALIDSPQALPDRHGRPRSLQERFQEEMQATSRGAQRSEANRSQGGWENWFYRQRAFPAGTIPAGAIQKALGQAIANNGGLHGAPGDPTPPGGPEPVPTWVSIGPGTIPNGQTDTSLGPPNPVSGRVSAIAVDPSNANIVYVGGAQGGVWRTTNALSSNPIWTPLTDHQASLAVGDIKIDPVNHNIIYVGTGEPNGSCDSYYGAGILRSTDGGVTWKQLGSDPGGPFANQSISRILIDPATAGSSTSTTLWASTALGFISSGTEQCSPAPGAWNGAVWRSTDSGNTWTLQNVPTGVVAPNQRIHDMVLDPTDSNILYVAVRPVPSASLGGIWKSTNAKGSPATFTKLAGGFPDTATASPGIRRMTVAIGGVPASVTLYASLESSQGLLWGMFKSTDSGATWSHLQAASGAATFAGNSAGTTVTASSGTFATDGSWIGRRMIFAGFHSGFIDSVTDSTHLHLSNLNFSGTGTWSVGSYPGYCDGQCFYDMTLAVDPTNSTASRLYIGGNPNVFVNSGSQVGASAHFVWESTDGGATWNPISQGSALTGGVHTDDHAIAFDSSVTPARVYDGNDGGIWRSNDQGASWVTMNTNVAITQFQSVSTNPTDPNVVIGGTQDNGTNILNQALQPPPAWFHSDFGDGGQAVIDQSTPLRMFHTYFNGAFAFMGPAKAIDGGINGPGPTFQGGSWDFVGAYYGYGPQYYNGLDPTEPVSFYAPLRTNPAFTPNVVYFGTNNLYRSADPQPTLNQTPSWTVKSSPGDLVSNTAGANFLSAIGVLPVLVSGKEVLYVGAADGRVSVSSNVDASGGVATWSAFNGGCPGTATAPLPCRFVTDIQVPGNDTTGNTAYVSFSGFNVNTPGQPGHIFRTMNGRSGTPTWTNISGDLPDTPVNAIVVDPSHSPNVLYVGTDIGVFQSLDNGVHWNYISTGHPVVSVFGLERNARTGQIVSSTHGRGMFQLVSDGLPDTTTPVCGGSVTGPGQFTGTALDAGANDTGIASIALTVGSSNLVISSITYSGAGSATYVVTTINHTLPGSGTVRVTDFAGNFCDTAVSIPAGVPAGGFFTLAPCRVIDTRTLPDGPIAVGVDRTFFVAGTCGIPADATSISTNVTVTQSTAGGDLKVFPGGTPLPIPAVINYSSGQTRANNVMIRLGAGSTITAHVDQASGTVQFILDVNGYFK